VREAPAPEASDHFGVLAVIDPARTARLAP
jgi:hypothetical protein